MHYAEFQKNLMEQFQDRLKDGQTEALMNQFQKNIQMEGRTERRTDERMADPNS